MGERRVGWTLALLSCREHIHSPNFTICQNRALPRRSLFTRLSCANFWRKVTFSLDLNSYGVPVPHTAVPLHLSHLSHPDGRLGAWAGGQAGKACCQVIYHIHFLGTVLARKPFQILTNDVSLNQDLLSTFSGTQAADLELLNQPH